MIEFKRNPAPVEKRKRHLPHWEQAGATYFITFRLGDSIPRAKLDQWRAHREIWLHNHPKPWSEGDLKYYYLEFQQRLERWADRGYGACHLRGGSARAVVVEALEYFDERAIAEHEELRVPRYRLGRWVVMPNHAHVVVTPLNDWKLETLLHTWKSLSAKRINRLVGRSGPLWMDERHDHIVRNPSSLRRIEQYVDENPGKAFLREGEFSSGGERDG